MTQPAGNGISTREYLEARLEDERNARETADLGLIRRLEKLDDAVEAHALRQTAALEEARVRFQQAVDEMRSRSDARAGTTEARLNRLEQRMAVVSAGMGIGGSVVGVVLGWLLHYVR